jgi:predicted AlkP superfamily pyrophosphatase or phosphodiesterase
MPASCKHVFVIGLDGAMGSAMQKAETPNIDALLAGGVASYSAQTVVPSSSYQAWGAMFHSVGPEKHKIDGEHPCVEDVPWPSYMKAIQQARPALKLASFSCWNPINTNIIERSVNCHRVSLSDPELAVAAADYIRATPPDVFFMQFDFIDGAGHSHGYGTASYLEQLKTTDAQVGQVINAIKASGVFDESLIVVVSDHGGVGKGHGGDHPDCLAIIWGARGPGVRRGAELGSEVSIMDTAPVILHALGLPAPSGWDGKVPEGVFA